MGFRAKSVGDISIEAHAQDRYYERVMNEEREKCEIIEKIEKDIKNSYFALYNKEDLGFYCPEKNIFFKFSASIYHTNDLIVTDKHIKTVFTTSEKKIFKLGTVTEGLKIQILEELINRIKEGESLEEIVKNK